ncbi:FAD-binding oxidoreductase [Mucilaginibacter sp. L3T2-6]|uniref:NAD(P)/FAD-dependent oxidoreductase n=1 Tax=Mucilaginibacter sp. L3T2-6 TaxID=3062491 RepID=UPI002675685C|nr:FAD-dependent oxidoreductase [Mucilaginibacter sp. L3T2-6]MDO3640542.1 FAD-dependent oxidoreductase [Mucilaginibacter sp. L3T2-6]MDV6213119.1 FAD-dependent oxidoreductase [Mucilaginibacter sp. L3T2-6]
MSKAIIIGGGVIGLFSAYYLHKSGWEVDILEQGDLTDNCSHGNAGMVTPSHFVPLASPGMIEQGIRWMFDSKSPFYVKPSLNKDLIGWGLKFMKSATKKHVDRSAGGLRDISLYSSKLYHEFEKDSGLNFDLTDNGILMLFKSQKVEEEERHMIEQATNLGLDAQYLTPEETRKLQPEIELDILGAVHYHCDSHMSPNKLMKGLVKYLEDAGVRIHRHTEVTRINHDGGKISSVSTRDKDFTGDKYLVAGGSWSPGIAKLAGLSIPLMPGKGYSFMVNNPVKKMTVPSILCEARVAITPMNGGIRFGGTMEIGKINDRVNMNRVRGIVESVPKYFPEFKLAVPDERDVWFGFRPCSPDGLPYIGVTKKYDNLAIATGHAMIGLGLAPATGKIIADSFNEQKPAIEAGLFDPDRYN